MSFHLTETDIWTFLEQVKDPEIPVLSIVDLGVLREVKYKDDVFEISITPTYTGCPAMNVIEEEILALLERNNVPCIFVELQLPTLFTLDELQEKIRLITSGFPAVQAHGVSCLMPIKEFCAEVYQTQKQSVNLVFDLLDALKAKNSIQAYFHINLQRELQNNTFTMQKYTVTDVHDAINKSAKSFAR